ncbi:MAG: ankyrin repeat domain-containing protein, partial [Pseudomonadota bacterium]
IDHVRAVLAEDPGAAVRAVGPRRPILHLAYSHHYRRVGTATQLAVAELLVAAGADVDDSYPVSPVDPHPLSALYGALGHAGNMDLAAWLLERGANPNDDESLYHSTELGHADGLRLLLRHGARPEGTNALLRAMDFDDVEMVTALLDHGADPNETELSALHQAARRMCSAPMAELLVARGTDGTGLYSGHSAYGLARMQGNHAVADVLERAGQAGELAPGEALIAAAADGPVTGRVDPATLTEEAKRSLTRLLRRAGTLAHAKRLVAIGIDPDWTDEQNLPAIHVAGWEGHADAVDWLLGFAPDFYRKNDFGGDLMGTIIHGAEFCPDRAERDHLSCARQVLAAGAP